MTPVIFNWQKATEILPALKVLSICMGSFTLVADKLLPAS